MPNTINHNIKEVPVYGAGLMARNVHRVLLDYPFQITISNFIVESKEKNPEEIGGIEVISLDEADKPYEISIQVGSNLTDKIMFLVRDNMEKYIL